jgi:hypothetical protein
MNSILNAMAFELKPSEGLVFNSPGLRVGAKQLH